MAKQPEYIGDYKVIRSLGEGGMGIVYLAEQKHPLDRRVAIKVVKPGMDSKEVITRFESERLSLAMMNHPSIAQVYDAGTTPEGRPFFVMEYVPGDAITEYCDQHSLTLKERLALFVPVCQAIHHAHQKGVVHRDIKPSNVLVSVLDGKPTPKVIDFGVAKALNKGEVKVTAFTAPGLLVGTPAYMSPEQADLTGKHIDTTTDVYSLGVLLYELLTDDLPFDSETLRESTWEEIRHLIQDVTPPRPSVRVGMPSAMQREGALRRRTAPATLQRQLRGELDWIVMKAMEKERGRRYQSALELAQEIERHLANQPVLARPPSTAYQVRKLVARHKLGFAFLTSIAALTVGFAVTMTVQARVIARERDRANLEATTSDQVSAFLIGLFAGTDPNDAKRPNMTAREMLDEGADKIRGQLAGQPEVRTRVMETIGQVYRTLGLFDKARPMLEEALAERRTLSGKEVPELSEAQFELAEVFNAIGEFDSAKTLHESSLAAMEATYGPDDPRIASTLTALGQNALFRNDYGSAKLVTERAISILERKKGPDSQGLAMALNSLGETLRYTGDFVGAESAYHRASAIWERARGPENTDVGRCANNIGIVLTMKGDYLSAESQLQRAVTILEKALGPSHHEVAQCIENLAEVYRETRQFNRAMPLYERALAIEKATFGSDHVAVAGALSNLAGAYMGIENYEMADLLSQQALEIRQRVLKPDDPEMGISFNNLGEIRAALHDYRSARADYDKALAIWEKSLGPSHPYVGMVLLNLGSLARDTGETAVAESLYVRSREILVQLGPNHPLVEESLKQHAELLKKIGDSDGASRLLARAKSFHEKTDDHADGAKE